jgi:hypothetical protein
MSDDEFEHYWAEQRKKNAHLIGPIDLEQLARERLEDQNSSFNKRFPIWTDEELAFYQADGSILLVANSNATKNSPASHGNRTYKPDNPNYQKVFEKHRFNERTDDYHWIVANEGTVIGEGWGKEVKASEE